MHAQHRHTLKELLLITPPFTQLNTPYPGTAYLKGFLNTKDISSFQMDLGIEVILEMFSETGLQGIFACANIGEDTSDNALRIFALRAEYQKNIQEVVRFLQGKNDTIARKICSENYLPEAARFQQTEDMEWAFGTMGIQDKAKYLATLFLEDLGDFIKECVDPEFGFSRYAERLGMSANSFDELHQRLNNKASYIDELALDILDARINKHKPILVCFSVPFPGNLYAAFKCAQYIKKHYPDIKIAMGGGFPNTELRSLTDVRVFEYFDYISLDDGELPIELIYSNVKDPSLSNPNLNFLKRTFTLHNNEVLYNNHTLRQDYKQEDLGTPDYSDLLLDSYISVIEVPNPMHSLWSDGRWLKLTMAHGCYWGKCTFCDISLDYIKLYEPITAKTLVDRMETMIAQTGHRGFHFVDEAAPPALMRALSIEIIRRGLKVSWWTNIRFEKSFDWDLCRLLQASGCIAVSGGLEVASNRLLKLIDKGVTVEQVAQVSRNFTDNGIMVHAYLMYAYPTQTIQETVDSLEMVRQLFEHGVLQSGFWHQFAMTAHSPVGMDPDAYGVTPKLKEISFANNDIDFTDSTGIDHDKFSYGLKKSLFNYMHGICFDYPLQEWFDFEIPETTISPRFILDSLNEQKPQNSKPSSKVIWIKSLPVENKMGTATQLILHSNNNAAEIYIETNKAEWIVQMLEATSVTSKDTKTLAEVRASYENSFEDFDGFWESEPMEILRELGLLVL